MAEKGNLQEATFAAGCFWHVEDAFMHLQGVEMTEVGFMGGHKDHPTYNQVCTHLTGHAEVVHLWFDPKRISYEQLVEFFWTMHDPTQHNRQGPDVGSQYRSAIFYYGEEQRNIAQASRDRLSASGKFRKTVATEVTPASTFWKAEEYHQKYFQKNGLSHCPA